MPSEPPPFEPPAFQEPWQAEAFAIVVALHGRGLFAWSEWTQKLGASIAAKPGGDYFDAWLDALEAMAADKGMAGRDELRAMAAAWRDAAEATPHGQPIALPPVDLPPVDLPLAFADPVERARIGDRRRDADAESADRMKTNPAPLDPGDLTAATDADVPDIVALMNRAYRGPEAAASWNSEAGYIAGDRTGESLVRADIAGNPEASFLVWRDRKDGGLEGCVWLEPLGGDAWYLGSLAIDPKRQNGGFGHALLAGAEQWARLRGGRRIRMSVVNVRDALIAWYRRRGYVETGETSPFPYGDNRFGEPQRDDLQFVVLQKDLPGADGGG